MSARCAIHGPPHACMAGAGFMAALDSKTLTIFPARSTTTVKRCAKLSVVPA